ncbi:PREDICTED: cilia- and flagella-associated protein 52 [Cyprinodon variegatus]|uniref:Cilia- and flagella-associated protein 52 n=1 Tax=Cyprinodon variegatus TaxID=28743 RepID=A0A3Q2DGZ9_CYPVA|nr:PREDICTED: cilia- and flagella-associated protein 52 [Cyprinodon variegatus]
MDDETQNILQLELKAVIGFNGCVPSGLRLHPDKKHLIYPLGNIVMLKGIEDGKQEFLRHSDNVSCISVSKSGSYIASGHISLRGFKAPVIIWNFAERTIYAELFFHTAKVEGVAFSPSDKYLVSLGGIDNNSIVLWNLETKEYICGSPASACSAGFCLTVRYSNSDDNIFTSAGSGTLRVWQLDVARRKIIPTECKTGKLTRIVKCIEISEDDRYMFCGTTSGDILKINMATKILNQHGPIKAKYNMGVNVLKMESGKLLVGSGSGILALCSSDDLKTIRQVQLEKGVTSIDGSKEGKLLFVGTEGAQMYRLNFDDLEAELISTGHVGAVNDIAIPLGTSELFATCSVEDIRVWRVGMPTELLRIKVPNMICNCLDFMTDGNSIISAWNDGKIRVFGPKSGRLMLTINNAHKMGGTAIAGTRDCKKIVSGGGDGEVCVWELLPHTHRLLAIMKKHEALVSCIKIRSDDKECVTASAGGTCIIWDLECFDSLQSVIASTFFKTVCYHPDEHQIVTSGTDKKITYWHVYDGSSIREREGSQSGAINSLDITKDGNHFVTGGDDRLLRVWDYLQGSITHTSMPHAASITCTRICSKNCILISGSADGGIWLWKFPHPLASS